MRQCSSGKRFGSFFEKQIAALVQSPHELLDSSCGTLEFRIKSISFSIGEFDPGSERTLAAGLTHASRTVTSVAVADG